jgi:hypothetical protein
MKTAYVKHRGNISETGQGLLDNGQEDDILEGSEVANIWDGPYREHIAFEPDLFLTSSLGKVKQAFPWYMRMHALMGSSPIVSKTPIDLSLLDRANGNVRLLTRSTPIL